MLNTLHAKAVPSSGGHTLFLDSSAALRAGAAGPFAPSELEALHASTLTVSHEWSGWTRRRTARRKAARDASCRARRSGATARARAVRRGAVSDFEGAPPEDIEPLGMPHVHAAVQAHPRTGEACLYLPLNPEGLCDARTGRHWAKNAELWARLSEAGFEYRHEWREGDVLLWDNLQVLHKAGGGFGDRPRLLLRTQTIYDGPDAAAAVA